MNTQFTLLISSNRDVEVEEAIVVNYYLSFIFTIYFIELLLTQNIFFVTYVLLFHVASLTINKKLDIHLLYKSHLCNSNVWMVFHPLHRHNLRGTRCNFPQFHNYHCHTLVVIVMLTDWWLDSWKE